MVAAPLDRNVLADAIVNAWGQRASAANGPATRTAAMQAADVILDWLEEVGSESLRLGRELDCGACRAELMSDVDVDAVDGDVAAPTDAPLCARHASLLRRLVTD